ncbi:MAG: thymidine kinase [Candidatus Dependentiae bacterium]|jgi:thymidine kinase
MVRHHHPLITLFACAALLSASPVCNADEAAQTTIVIPEHSTLTLKAVEPVQKRGKLIAIAGCMFAGKTEELMRLCRRYECAGKVVVTIKFDRDNRVSADSIDSHAGKTRRALPANDEQSARAHIPTNVDVVAIEEIQFFNKDIVNLVEELVEQGVTVIVSGLDTDYRKLPFGVMPGMLTQADEVTKLSAICVQCGNDARFTQRITNGKPARWDEPTVQVGAEESYEARCRDCFEAPVPPAGWMPADGLPA